MRVRGLLLHALNVAAPLVVFAIAPSLPWALLGAVALFFGCFALAHDAMHGSLGLSRRLNEAVLLVFGAAIGVSGTAVRFMHLRHHARPMADDDLEGRGARTTLGRAFLLGPAGYLLLFVRSLREAPRRMRARQLVGWALVAAYLATLLVVSPRTRLLALVVLVGQMTISVWGSHLPHRGPTWLARAASKLDALPSSLVVNLAHHERHHRLPRIGCFDLPRAR